MKTFASVTLFILALSSRGADWKPEDIHPKVFQMVDCWMSDTAAPVVTEINLDAVRTNRNQFDYSTVEEEDGWIVFREEKSLIRFRVSKSGAHGHSVVYQENGGGTLTTQRVIRFTMSPRSFEVDGEKITATVVRIISIADVE